MSKLDPSDKTFWIHAWPDFVDFKGCLHNHMLIALLVFPIKNFYFLLKKLIKEYYKKNTSNHFFMKKRLLVILYSCKHSFELGKNFEN